MTKWEPTALRGHAFHWNQNLLQIQKEGNSILGNTQTTKEPTVSFLTCVTFLYSLTSLSITHFENDDR